MIIIISYVHVPHVKNPSLNGKSNKIGKQRYLGHPIVYAKT